MTDVDETQLASARAETVALVRRIPAEITSVAQYDDGASTLRDIKQRKNDLDSLRKSMTRPLDDAKARIIDLFRPIIGDLDYAEAALKAQMVRYQEAEDRRVAEEQAAAELERAQAEAEAMRAAEAGQYEDAMRIQQERAEIPDPEPAYKARDARGYKPAAGVTSSTRWSAEVTDFPALVLAVAMGEAPLNLLTVNQSALDKSAQIAKAESTIPGVKFVSRKVIAATGRR